MDPNDRHEAAARAAHEANRALQAYRREPARSPAWEDAPDWMRASTRRGVERVAQGASPANLHQAWMDERAANGYVYGHVKDHQARTHPEMLPYDRLTNDQRLKDQMFAAVVRGVLGL